MTDEEKIEKAGKRYGAAAHAMQSGVAAEMSVDIDPTSTKHLRVGVNSAMVDSSALAVLLIEKGVFTKAEYAEAIADAMEAEKARYEEHLSKIFGRAITLA